MNTKNRIYKISISPKLTGYDHVNLQAENQGGDSSLKHVVNVDTKKFIALCKKTESNLNDTILFSKKSEHDKKEIIAAFNPENKSLHELAIVEFIKMVSVKSLIFENKELPLFMFTNGRNRIRFIAENGAKCIPIQCNKKTAEKLQEFVGCE